ncbi:MAG: 2-C-methyl-D-erythritol 4-phosphate cytidylyltransferase [Thermodesulfovibrionales bacterium]
MVTRVIAIVPAAGVGRRFGTDLNKPFVELGGKPLVLWALEALQAAREVDEIIPVLKASDLEAGACLVEERSITKVKRIAEGGHERQDSVYNALRLVKDGAASVVVHDGARPFLERALIREALMALEGHDGSVVAVPAKDTIKEADGQGLVAGTLRREALWQVQTPQAFPFATLFEAYARAAREGFCSTDDSALVERMGGRIKIVMGSYKNIKITTPEDLDIAELFLKKGGLAP